MLMQNLVVAAQNDVPAADLGAATATLTFFRSAHANRASNVPVDIAHTGGITNRVVDQRTNGGTWVSVGAYSFAAGTGGSVLIRTEATNGYVVADAVRFVAV